MQTAVLVVALGVSLFFLVPSHAINLPVKDEGDGGEDGTDGDTGTDENAVLPCQLPMEKCKKNCKPGVTYYYYDCKSKTCKAFCKGYCGQNANNFKNKEECEKKCSCPSPRCKLPMKKCNQNCKKNVIYYYYDCKSKTCKEFCKGYCGANKNSFESKKECEKECDCSSPHCQLPMKKCNQNCKKNVIYYYYDCKSKTCKEFCKGYCGANKNSFESKKECEKECGCCSDNAGNTGNSGSDPTDGGDEDGGDGGYGGYGGDGGDGEDGEDGEDEEDGGDEDGGDDDGEGRSEEPEGGPDDKKIPKRCRLPMKKCNQNCKKNVIYYYYDCKSKTCKEFCKGYCGANKNSFESKKECEKECGCSVSPCTLPMKKCNANCKKNVIYYYYDCKSKTCKEFCKGYCGSNANSFESKKKCQEKCIPDPCMEPIVKTKCNDCKTMYYYYNKTSGLCQEFPPCYCGKNSNSFKCLKECKMCVKKDVPPCKQPVMTYECKKSGDTYYYNQKTNKCEKYDCCCCGSTENDFKSKEDCEKCVQKDYCPKDDCCATSKKHDECRCDDDCCQDCQICCKTRCGNKCTTAVHTKVNGAGEHLSECDPKCKSEKK